VFRIRANLVLRFEKTRRGHNGKSGKAGIVGDLTANCAECGEVARLVHCKGLNAEPTTRKGNEMSEARTNDWSKCPITRGGWVGTSIRGIRNYYVMSKLKA